jgi:hypothetical protein
MDHDGIEVDVSRPAECTVVDVDMLEKLTLGQRGKVTGERQVVS